jgi:hypothetical protein
MKTHLKVGVAALMVLAATTACGRTTEGTVAMTTEPGPPINSPTRTPPSSFPGIPGMPNIPIPNLPIPRLPIPGPSTNVPVVPAPPNALTMKCQEFTGLDDATRLAVIREILKSDNNPLGPNGESIGQMLVEAACQFLPNATVSEVLTGSPPR